LNLMQESLSHLLYKEYNSVSVYPYVQNDSDVEFILLRETKTGKISAITGQSGSIDACILFTAARCLLSETNGLFTETNLLTNDTDGLKPLVLRKPEHYNCNLLLNEPEFNSLMKHMTKTAEHVDIASDTKVITFPIRSIDLKEFNSYLGKTKDNYEVVSVSASALKELKESNLESSTEEHLKAILANIFASIPLVINETRRKHYAVITCFDPSITSRMYDHCEYLLQGQFRRQDESWHYFKAALDELPDVSLLEKLDGIIIPGAAGSCYTPGTKWIPKLEKFIRHIYKNTKIRYLGLCYGAQILAQALGGTVERNHRIGFKAATEEITLMKEFWDQPFVKTHRTLCVKKPKSLVVIKSHGDHITKLPEDATLLGSSETTKVEIFTVGDRFFATQGHPEYSTDFVCSRDGSIKISEATDEEIEAYEATKKARREKSYAVPEDKFDLRTICANFLKNVE
jgi:GMP synthase-like glutamine amidotransferase